ncbi:MAG: DUF4433 domain-containing protein [Acidobacteria bacterium]|nr:DUF4433 domain-containing protein [Acidobacteriota bacterium]MCW5968508.1 DUF4433 domain-containing protein [Blastocatellales bacterium]
MNDLGRQKALIFRITHIDNVAWMLANGLHCADSERRDPNYREIGNPDLIGRRERRVVPVSPGGTLKQYIPFYFTPHSPMLLNIKTGYGGLKQTPMPEIVILVSSLNQVKEAGIPFVFTDRHAYLATAEFFSELEDLDRIDWELLQSRNFRRDPEDPGSFERYQAEALIHRHLPCICISGIVCYGSAQEMRLLDEQKQAGITLNTIVKPDWYF